MQPKIDGEWIRCAKCGHKLGKIIGEWADDCGLPAIEHKCHSCGTLNYIMVGKKEVKNEPK